MADLARVKRNVAKMVDMGAPETDIDAYIAEEATTVDAVRSFRSQPTGPMINIGDQQMTVADYQAMPDAQRQQLRDQIVQANPDAPGMARPDGLAPFVQGTTFGFGDEIRGAAQGGMAAMQGGDYGNTYRQTVDQSRADLDAQRRQHPVASFASEIAGAIPTAMAAGGAQLAGRGATLGARALSGSAVGAAQGAAYGAGTGEGNIQERLPNAGAGAALGGAVGAAAPYIGNAAQKLVQRGQQGQVLNQAAKAAPAVSDIKSAASAMFDQADNANISVTRPAFGRLMKGIETSTKSFRPNATLDPKATGALQVLQSVADDVMKPGSNVLPDLKDIHMLRQAAQRAAVSSEGRDAAIANRIVSSIDDFVRTLKPADVAGGADPRTASNALMKGIQTWARASKAGIVEEAIYKAQNVASGVENGLRIEFRKILQNPKLRGKFNAAELQAIEDVVKGNAMSNAMKLAGKFGFGGGNSSNMLGGTIGFGAGSMTPLGPIGGVLAAGAGTLARKGSEKLTEGAASRALGAVATEGLKVVPPVNPATSGLLEQLLRQSAVPASGQAARNF